MNGIISTNTINKLDIIIKKKLNSFIYDEKDG